MPTWRLEIRLLYKTRTHKYQKYLKKRILTWIVHVSRVLNSVSFVCVTCTFSHTINPSQLLQSPKSLTFFQHQQWRKTLLFSVYCFLFLRWFLLRSSPRNHQLMLRNLFLHWIILISMTLLRSTISSSLNSTHLGMIRFFYFIFYVVLCFC